MAKKKLKEIVLEKPEVADETFEEIKTSNQDDSFNKEEDEPLTKKQNKDVEEVIRKVTSENADVEQPSEQAEDPQARRKLIMKLKKYQISFGQYVNDTMNHHDLETLDMKQLQQLLEEIKLIVACRGQSNVVREFYYGGCQLLEAVSPKLLGTNLNGFTQAIQSSEDIALTLDEISIEMDMLEYISPEQRLVIATMGILKNTYIMNKYLVAQTKAVESNITQLDVNKDIIESYADI